MKLMIGLLLICIGLAAAIPYMGLPKADPKADVGDNNPFVELQKELADEKIDMFDADKFAENTNGNPGNNRKTVGDELAKQLFGIDTEKLKNVGNTPVSNPNSNEQTNKFVKPEKEKPPIEITKFPGKSNKFFNNKKSESWNSNKFITNNQAPAAAATPPPAAQSAATPASFGGVVNPIAKQQTAKQKVAGTFDADGKFQLPSQWRCKSANAAGLVALENAPAPELDVIQWNRDPKQKAKVTLVIFWATWCGECKQSVDNYNDLYLNYRGDNVEIVGVCDSTESELMDQVVKQTGIQFPVGIDKNQSTAKAFHVGKFPSFYVIDEAGNVRAANVRTNKLTKVIDALLAE